MPELAAGLQRAHEDLLHRVPRRRLVAEQRPRPPQQRRPVALIEVLDPRIPHIHPGIRHPGRENAATGPSRTSRAPGERRVPGVLGYGQDAGELAGARGAAAPVPVAQAGRAGAGGGAVAPARDRHAGEGQVLRCRCCPARGGPPGSAPVGKEDRAALNAGADADGAAAARGVAVGGTTVCRVGTGVTGVAAEQADIAARAAPPAPDGWPPSPAPPLPT